MRVELTDGAWADVRDVSELRNGDRKAVNKAIGGLHIDPETEMPIIQPTMDDDMREALLKRFITGWSFTGLPLPRDDPESLEKLSLADADLLYKSVDEHMKLIKGESDPAKPGSVPTEG